MCLIKTKCGNMSSPAQNIILILLNNEHLAIVRSYLNEEINFFDNTEILFQAGFYSYGQNYLNKIFIVRAICDLLIMNY